jgi:hypothetical protein
VRCWLAAAWAGERLEVLGVHGFTDPGGAGNWWPATCPAASGAGRRGWVIRDLRGSCAGLESEVLSRFVPNSSESIGGSLVHYGIFRSCQNFAQRLIKMDGGSSFFVGGGVFCANE